MFPGLDSGVGQGVEGTRGNRRGWRRVWGYWNCNVPLFGAL